MHSFPARFITFEGIDSSGKSTQCTRTRAWLEKHDIPHLFVREPGGTAVSERVRDILLDREHHALRPVAELLLFSAARAQLIGEVIRPALARGTSIIADRFLDSTTAYQGHGRGIDLSSIAEVHRLATGGLLPDITFLLDIDVAESRRRRAAQGRDDDRMEAADEEFFARVATGYRSMAAAEPGRITLFDGRDNPDAIFDRIERILRHTYFE